MFFSTSLTKNSAPPPNYVLYISAKGAVEHLVRVLAKDLGAKGITVNAICPGPADTDLFREGKTEQQIQFFANMHPLKRIATPDEIAPIVAFLARDEARWINGEKMYVNGVCISLIIFASGLGTEYVDLTGIQRLMNRPHLLLLYV